MMFRKGKFVYIEIDGKVNTVAGWCREFGIKRSVLMYRYEVMGLRGRNLAIGANRVPKELTKMPA
jgi:hypothetical protein